MKRVKKRSLRTKKTKVRIKKAKQTQIFESKQAILFKILIICIFILIILIAAYVVVYEPKPKEKELEGELGTLCIFCSENTVVLDVLNYTIAPDNSSVNVDINWSAGDINASDFNSILIDFEMRAGADCNYTINSSLGLPWFGENRNYTIAEFNPGCPESDFSNVTEVLAYAEINIHLIQTSLIPDITLYKDDSRTDLIHLNNYFSALTEINYNITENPNNDYIELIIDDITKNISVSFLDDNWFGAQQFDLSASTEEEEVLTSSFNIILINDTRITLNHEPEFNEDECESFSWDKDTNKTIDMDSCWSDEDEDNLNYNYSELNNHKENISIVKLSGNRIRFAPKPGFNGSTYLTLYANDSHEVVSHRVYIHILSNDSEDNLPLETAEITNPEPTNELEIKSSSPAESSVSFFVEDTKSFSIVAENYEGVEWYVDNILVKEGDLFYNFEEKKPGVYNIRVSVIKGSSAENRIWEVTIEEAEQAKETIFGVSVGEVIFYLILVVLIMIIILIIWLLIIGIKRKNRKMDLGFGVSVVPNRNGVDESSNQFNIPKD